MLRIVISQGFDLIVKRKVNALSLKKNAFFLQNICCEKFKHN